MNEYQLVADNHPLLSQILPNYDFPADVDTVMVANNIAEFMFKTGGIGLSANQLGLPYRMFVMRTAPNLTVCINARIVDSSQEDVMMEEGCLSYPGLHVKIKRPAHIKVRYQTVTGETVTEKFTGLTARVFQHELDHMNGMNFLDRAGAMAREVAMRKWEKQKKLIKLKRKSVYGR